MEVGEKRISSNYLNLENNSDFIYATLQLLRGALNPYGQGDANLHHPRYFL